MAPAEIMLAASQERLMLVVKQGRESEVEQIFDKWDLHAVRIGQVTTDGRMKVKNHGDLVADIPNTALTDEAPVCPLYYYVNIQFFDGERLGGIEANLLDEHPIKAMYWKKR